MAYLSGAVCSISSERAGEAPAKVAVLRKFRREKMWLMVFLFGAARLRVYSVYSGFDKNFFSRQAFKTSWATSLRETVVWPRR